MHRAPIIGILAFLCSVKGIPTYLTVRVNVRMVDENVNENPSIGIQEPPTKFRSILTKIGPV